MKELRVKMLQKIIKFRDEMGEKNDNCNRWGRIYWVEFCVLYAKKVSCI